MNQDKKFTSTGRDENVTPTGRDGQALSERQGVGVTSVGQAPTEYTEREKLMRLAAIAAANAIVETLNALDVHRESLSKARMWLLYGRIIEEPSDDAADKPAEE